MTKKRLKQLLSVTLILALIAAMALSLSGCKKDEPAEKTAGAVTITVEIVDDEGKSTEYEITTEETTLWGALEQEKLAEGEDGPYGIMINSVCGIRAVYELDNAYWALSKDGEYLMSGAETTQIADGEHYEIVYTPA